MTHLDSQHLEHSLLVLANFILLPPVKTLGLLKYQRASTLPLASWKRWPEYPSGLRAEIVELYRIEG